MSVGVSTRLLKQGLVGARASFQRHSDARMFHGHVLSIDGGSASISAAPSVVLRAGDLFAFRIVGLGGDVAFTGKLLEWWSDDTPNLVALAGSTVAVVDYEQQTFLFEIQGRIQSLPSSGDARFLRTHGTVSLCEGQIEASMQDMSLNGLGIISPEPLKADEVVTFRVFTAMGEVSGEAEIRYCRPIPTVPVSYRIGMRLMPLDRVNAARWRVLLLRR